MFTKKKEQIQVLDQIYTSQGTEKSNKLEEMLNPIYPYWRVTTYFNKLKALTGSEINDKEASV